MTDLFQAIKDHSYSSIVKAFREGQDVNVRNEHGNTPLLLAIDQKDPESVDILLESEANPNLADLSGRYPLLVAIEIGEKKVVESLLNKGADINSRNLAGKNALEVAIEKGDDELVSKLMEKGAEVSANTILMLAIENSKEALALAMLEKDVDINAKDEQGRTPLTLATEKKKPDLVNVLLDKGADINIANGEGKSPLTIATEDYNPLIDVLMEKGAEVKVTDNEGRTPLIWAIKHKDFDLVEILLEKGVDAGRMYQDKSMADLAFAEGEYTMVSSLVSHGSALSGSSVLSATRRILEEAKFGSVRKLQDYIIVKELLNEGKGLDAKDEDGKNILHLLVENYNSKLSYLLRLTLSKGGDPNSQDNMGRTPLHYAVLNVNIKLTRDLILHGADVNIADKGNTTPYQIATMFGSMQMQLSAGKKSLKQLLEPDVDDEKENGAEV